MIVRKFVTTEGRDAWSLTLSPERLRVAFIRHVGEDTYRVFTIRAFTDAVDVKGFLAAQAIALSLLEG